MNRFTQSNYEGEKIDNWPHGTGKYIFPNGTIYQGQFFQGNFHGDGILTYQDGSKVKGVWNQGKLVEKKLIFQDELEYKENNWDYCTL